jgi:hypothetical protein
MVVWDCLVSMKKNQFLHFLLCCASFLSAFVLHLDWFCAWVNVQIAGAMGYLAQPRLFRSYVQASPFCFLLVVPAFCAAGICDPEIVRCLSEVLDLAAWILAQWGFDYLICRIFKLLFLRSSAVTAVFISVRVVASAPPAFSLLLVVLGYGRRLEGLRPDSCSQCLLAGDLLFPFATKHADPSPLAARLVFLLLNFCSRSGASRPAFSVSVPWLSFLSKLFGWVSCPSSSSTAISFGTEFNQILIFVHGVCVDCCRNSSW